MTSTSVGGDADTQPKKHPNTSPTVDQAAVASTSATNANDNVNVNDQMVEMDTDRQQPCTLRSRT